MKILVTGGRGMVGSNIRKHPLFSKSQILAPSSQELNLLDYGSLESYLKNNHPDFVIHCAGRVGGISANMSAPFEFLSENLLMGLNLVKAMKNVEIPKLLNLASSCMYPRNIENPLSENKLLKGELEPTNEGYAIAKIAVWKMCEYVTQSSNLQYKTIIPCNLYGPYDKFDELKAHLIPAIIRKVHEAKAKNLDSVEIWGSGNARREFMFIDDLVEAVHFSMQNFDKLPSVFNCGTGVDYSINDYYHITAKALGYAGKFHHDLSKPEGMKQKLTDVSVLSQLGWKSHYTLEEGITKTYQYFKKENS